MPNWERSTRHSTEDHIIMKESSKSIHYHLQGAPLCFSCFGESKVWLFDYEQMFFPGSLSCCSNLNVNVSHKSIWWQHHHHNCCYHHVFFYQIEVTWWAVSSASSWSCTRTAWSFSNQVSWSHLFLDSVEIFIHQKLSSRWFQLFQSK